MTAFDCSWPDESDLMRAGTIREARKVDGRLEDYVSLDQVLSEHQVDTVFHLGAQTQVGDALREPLATFEANVRGTYNLLEACRVHRDIVERVVIASSDKAYGAMDGTAYTEARPLLGRYPYDVSKSCTDLLAQSYWHSYELAVAIARCGNVFGGGDLNWDRIVPGTIKSLLAEERPVIRSDGLFTRDYIFVDDVVEAYKTLAEAIDRPEVRGNGFNFGPKAPHSVLEVIAELSVIMECTDLEPMILNQANGEIVHQHLDSEKAARVLGWHVGSTFTDGLRRTVDWYRAYLSI